MSIELKPFIEDRVYIGNVDYKATEEELRELFSGLTVTEVDIPSKSIHSGKKVLNKSLGFAFVQFETKEDADTVIENYNGKEFKGRKVYVKKAVPPPTEEEKAKKAEIYRAKRQAQQEAQKAAAAIAAAEEEEKKSAAAAATATSTASPPSGKKTPKKSTPRPKLPLEEGTKSTDTIFITNLAFDVNVKTLTAIFKDYKPIWIHIPIRKVPYKLLNKRKAEGKPLKNKGIAFVKLADESLQKKAIEEFNGKEIGDRVVVVDVAIDARISTPEGEGNKSEVEVPEPEKKVEEAIESA
ncbi:hypothetical protein CAAN1_02S06084 [[Candida] anglica]|uniref:RRM domain-containing protein n=1 Tax=[Candida] anglica TaxID=148631 RepID=A0ABP0EC68_9ASCO